MAKYPLTSLINPATLNLVINSDPFMDKQAAKRQPTISLEKFPTARGLGVCTLKDKIYLFFHSNKGDKDFFEVAYSVDGLNFEKETRTAFIAKPKSTKEDIAKTSNYNFYKFADDFLLTYKRTEGKKETIEKAWVENFNDDWMYEGPFINFKGTGVIVGDFVNDKNFYMYGGSESVFLYSSRNLVEWHKGKEVLAPRDGSFDGGSLEVSFTLVTEKGILVLYNSKVDGRYATGVALFDLDDPSHLLWRAKEPLWVTPQEQKNKLTPIGTTLLNGQIISYWQTKTEGIYAAVFALFKASDGHKSKDVSLRLKRVSHNPIISPRAHNSWEAFNTFNPAAIYYQGKVHILYRAQGHDYVSVVGYATSSDGIHVDERLDRPIYVPSQGFDTNSNLHPEDLSFFYISGGGYGGVEDPRITKIDDKFYLTYVAFDGVSPPRIALTSISEDNFLNRRWLWERPVLISPPEIVDKSAVIFPEKINGKYVIMHRIYPDILIDFVDSLNFNGRTWLKGEYRISPRSDHWDSRKIGAGAPPIKTKHGWLLIYQSVGEQDSSRYKIGAMLLDLKDPTKVLYRSQSPILEPEAHYENNGFKAGVVYPCGAVVIDDTLYVYYGGADSYVCVATANLEEFLQELMHSEVARLNEPVFEQLF